MQNGYFTWIGVQVGSIQPFHIFLVSFAFFMIVFSSLDKLFVPAVAFLFFSRL